MSNPALGASQQSVNVWSAVSECLVLHILQPVKSTKYKLKASKIWADADQAMPIGFPARTVSMTSAV